MISTTNITDLCSDCLLAIFKYLEVSDLATLNEITTLAKRTNQIDRYKATIVTAFKIKVGVHQWTTEIYANSSYAPNDINMLKSFGSHITSLLIDYSSKNRRYESVFDDTISKYCWKTLSDVHFKYLNRKSMNELQRPFVNVHAVEFSDGHLGNTLGQLNKWFPKMELLEFGNTYVFDPKCIHKHFPLLDTLSVSNGRWQESKEGRAIFTNSDLKVFVELNRQLEQLNITHDDVDETVNGHNAIIVDEDLLSSISYNLNVLGSLKLNLENYRFDQQWQSTVEFGDHLYTLEVNCGNYDCLDKIKIEATDLTELNVNLTDEQDVQLNYEALATFVIRVDPTRLKINVEYHKFSFDNLHVRRMTRELPELQDLIIVCAWYDAIPDTVLELLVNSDTLEKLVGAFHFRADPDNLRRHIRRHMQERFRVKIDRNDAVKKQWSYKFSETYDGLCYICAIEFHKKK